MLFSSARIDRSTVFRYVYSNLYKSFESDKIFRFSDMRIRLHIESRNVLPSSISLPIARISAAAFDLTGV